MGGSWVPKTAAASRVLVVVVSAAAEAGLVSLLPWPRLATPPSCEGGDLGACCMYKIVPS